MRHRAARLLMAVLGGGIAAVLVRRAVHSKVPPPQGRWREIPEESLR